MQDGVKLLWLYTIFFVDMTIETEETAMELNILRADPAGNITIFVLDPIEKAQRASIAEKIMAIPALKAEQVGYACPPEDDADGRMEMMGGEFCGNATRAYGMYIAQQKGGASEVKLRVSGCDHVVTAQVDLKAGTARAEMPCPRSVQRVTVNGHEGTLVDLTGIAHFVVEGVKPSEEFFHAVEPVFSGIAGLDACGVIFLDAETHRMTPLVKVIDTNSLVWEGSCGSGTVACAVAQSEGMENGGFSCEYIQPAGIVRASVERRSGRVLGASIGGKVTLDNVTSISLPDL